MKLIIDIPKHYYKLKDIQNGSIACSQIVKAVKNGIPYEEKPPGEWISVSEKLPEDMQRVLVWFEYYRYGNYNCMYQTYGFGYVFDGKWSPCINGETGWQDYRIIAWQPLPEPYMGGLL